ncbi:hypothetical protein AAHC03_0905 [Spirometra sp. Aus1]
MAPEPHPAFYHSKKRIWDFPVSPPALGEEAKWRLQIKTFCLGGFDQLWKLWYTVFLFTSNCWLVWLAIRRYLEFKSQAYNPRFGEEWNYEFPLNFQIVCLVVVIGLFPLLIYSAVARVGHAANDCITLGKDCVHLHGLLARSPVLRFSQNDTETNSNGGTSNNISADRLRSQLAHSSVSLAELDFESFIISDTEEGCCAFLRRQLRPFAGLIHVIIAFALFVPIAVLQAEQIKNEAIDPAFARKSNLDWLLSGFGSSSTLFHSQLPKDASTQFGVGRTNRMDPQVPLQDNFLRLAINRQSSSSFPSHPFPSQPAEISIEFVLLASSLVILTIRFAAPFWFTSRAFSILFSVYTALTGCYILLEAAAVEVLVKLTTAGSRDAAGNRISIIAQDSQLVDPWICMVVSTVSFLFLLAGLVAFYASGELLFRQAVNNYARLIVAGEFDLMSQRKTSTEMFGEDRESQGSALFPVPGPEGGPLFKKPIELFLGPSVIAVTTKTWRPHPIRKQTTNTTTHSVLPQSMSGASDRSATLRSRRISTSEGSPKRNSKKIKSSVAFWPAVVSGVSLACLLATRACLFGPMLQCYWYSKVGLPLTFVIFSILYIILWLVLWFGISVKTAWRFRMLHTPSPVSSSSRTTSPRHMPHTEGMTVPPWPLSYHPSAQRFGAGYLWPWLQYQPGWVAPNGGSLAFGSSPVPFDTSRQPFPSESYAPQNAMLERGPSAMDSVYGCFTDIAPAVNDLPADLRSAGGSGGLLRAGPPTLSDESDNAVQATHTPNAMRVSHSISNAKLSNYAHLRHQGSPPQLPTSQQTQMDHMGCDGGSYEINNDSDESPPAFISVSQIRASLDPTYASLVNGRASSGSPEAGEVHGRTIRASSSSRRIGPPRVTFKEQSKAVSGDETFCTNAVSDTNNGSSDSGVCTNGSGSQRPPIVRKLSLSNFTLFNGSKDINHSDANMAAYESQLSPQGFITTASNVRLETDDRLCSQV